MKFNDGDVQLETNKKLVTEKIVASSSDGLLLEDDGGNYIKINDGGIVDISKTSSVSVYLGTAHSIDNVTRTKIRLDTEEFDLHGEFDPSSNYRFTATKAGHYAAFGQCCINGLADLDLMICSIYKNGSIIADTRIEVGGATSPRFPVSKITYLAINDYLELWVYHNFGSNLNIEPGINDTYLTIHKLS